MKKTPFIATRGCYSHGLSYRQCPTPILCLIRRVLARVGWALIALAQKERKKKK